MGCPPPKALYGEGSLSVVRSGARFFAVTAALWTVAPLSGQAITFEELTSQAATARRGNHIPQAIELYRQAVQVRESWVEGWWFLGTLSYAAYRYADCESAFDRFVKLDDKRALAWSLLGLCEFETGKYDPALDHLRQGLAPDNGLAPEVEAGVRFHYGLLLTKAGLFDQGKRELEGYARGGAHEPALIQALGLNALRQPCLPKEVPAERLDAVTKAGTAARFWILGEIDKAEAGFQELVREFPTLAGVHYLYGTYLSYTRPEDAMAEFRRELELTPPNADAEAMLALLLVNANDLSGALPYAKKAAAERPSDALAEYAYGEVLMRTGELRPAIARLEAAERLDPAALQYHMALARVYSRAGRAVEARRQRRISLDMAAGVQGGEPPRIADGGAEVRARAKPGDTRPPENR
jgi:tetratricopeptide (TPR) repeat protein